MVALTLEYVRRIDAADNYRAAGYISPDPPSGLVC
jgi:hypothetical protein